VTRVALRVYTIAVGLVCAIAVTYSLHQERLSAAMQQKLAAWQSLAQQTVAHDHAATHEAMMVAARYNRLVRSTAKSETKLLRALKQARWAAAHPVAPAAGASPAPTSYVAAPVAAPSAAAPVAAPAPAPAPAPPTTSSSHP
jgi:peptidoglycan DL-endopeptidase CwlO